VAIISLVSGMPFADLVAQHMGMIRIISRKYYMPGCDFEDTVQEGLIGLYKAARDYKPDVNSSFRCFAAMVIERQLISALKAARRGKAMILTQAERFEFCVQENRYSHKKELEELIASDTMDPLDKIIAREEAFALWHKVKRKLSLMEFEVLKYHLAGYSIQETAMALSCNDKAVDNALTRSKNKFKAEIKEPTEFVG
jgi:RNA polymerase sporulation-specific sigma factor